MFKKLLGTAALTALITVVPSAYFDTAEAQRSSGSSYSRPSSSSSVSRPSSPSRPSAAPSRPSSGSSYSRPPSRPAASAPSRPGTPSAQPQPAAPRVATPPPRSQSGYARPSMPTQALPPQQSNRSALPSALIGGAAGAAVGSTLSQPAQADSASQSGYTRPSTSTDSARSQPAPTPPSTALNDAARRTMSTNSLEQYRKERAEAKAPPKPVNAEQVRRDPVFTETRRNYGSVDDYMSQRSRHVQDYRQRYPEAYRYNQGMSPNYGMFDSNFLMGLMLGHLGSSSNSNAAWLNSQRDQEWYRQWRADLDRKAVENSDLKERLGRMDAEMAELRLQNANTTAPSLPAGVPGSLAIAPEAVIAAEDRDSKGISWFWYIAGFTLLIAGGVLFYLHNLGSIANRRRYSY
jgi:hypothetical protein